MDGSLRSQCPVVTGLWAAEEHHSVCTCVRHPDDLLSGSAVCREGRTAAKVRVVPDSVELCFVIGFQAAAPPL